MSSTEGLDTPEDSGVIDESTLPPEVQEYYNAIRESVFAKTLGQLQNRDVDIRVKVLVAHGFLELMINAIVDAKLKNHKKITSDNRGYPHAVRLLMLNEIGFLTDHSYKNLDQFRKFRNRAAHAPVFKPDLKITETLPDGQTIELTVDNWLTRIVGGFWNEHLDILAPVFMPKLKQPAK